MTDETAPVEHDWQPAANRHGRLHPQRQCTRCGLFETAENSAAPCRRPRMRVL